MERPPKRNGNFVEFDEKLISKRFLAAIPVAFNSVSRTPTRWGDLPPSLRTPPILPGFLSPVKKVRLNSSPQHLLFQREAVRFGGGGVCKQGVATLRLRWRSAWRSPCP